MFSPSVRVTRTRRQWWATEHHVRADAAPLATTISRALVVDRRARYDGVLRIDLSFEEQQLLEALAPLSVSWMPDAPVVSNTAEDCARTIADIEVFLGYPPAWWRQDGFDGRGLGA